MTKRKAPPPVPFFTVEPTNEQRASKEKSPKLARNREEAKSAQNQSPRANGFTVHTRLPSLNEYIADCRANRYKGAKLKADTDTVIAYAVMQALQRGELRRPTPPVRIAFTWHEKTKRRDADNIASAKKYILDAMQKVGIIPNDSRKYVTGFTDEIIDDDRDFVEVRIIECNGNFADTIKKARDPRKKE